MPDHLTGDPAKVIGVIDAFTNTGPGFTRDGKSLVFLSTRDGLAQVYTATVEGPARRVVTHPQRIGEVLAAPGGKDLLFSSDTGADENWAFYRAPLDGKPAALLTKGKLNRDKMFVPDGRPSQIYFTARAMAEARSTLYLTPATAPGEAKAIYTDELPTQLRAVSTDGKFALLKRSRSRSDNAVLRVELETGKAEQVFPAEGSKVTVFEAALSRDGKRALIATDTGEEACVLISLDLASGKVLAKRAFAPTAMVTGLAVAKEGALLAVSLAVGPRSEIQLLDLRSLAVRTTVAMPTGTGVATEFSDDGKQLLVSWSTPDHPSDVFVVDPQSGKVKPRNEPRPSLPNVSIEASSVEVPAFDGGQIHTNVMVAKGEASKRHPVAVVFHGGPQSLSAIRWNPLTAILIAQGYVVVEPNIRGSTGFGRAFEQADNGPLRPASLKDVETVSRWVGTQPWADKDRLVVMGGSYGGYLTLIALTRWPDIFRAGVDLFGVVDLRTTLKTTSGLIRAMFVDEMGDADKDAAFLATISPITDLAKLVDPLFVYAGANDPRVPRAESDRVVAALRARKVPVEYMVADNEGHSLARRETQVGLYSRMLRFLEQHVK